MFVIYVLYLVVSVSVLIFILFLYTYILVDTHVPEEATIGLDRRWQGRQLRRAMRAGAARLLCLPHVLVHYCNKRTVCQMSAKIFVYDDNGTW